MLDRKMFLHGTVWWRRRKERRGMHVWFLPPSRDRSGDFLRGLRTDQGTQRPAQPRGNIQPICPRKVGWSKGSGKWLGRDCLAMIYRQSLESLSKPHSKVGHDICLLRRKLFQQGDRTRRSKQQADQTVLCRGQDCQECGYIVVSAVQHLKGQGLGSCRSVVAKEISVGVIPPADAHLLL